MDKKLKSKWIKALRSGKYKQARGILLQTNGAMCCLGVLAHIQGCPKRKLSGQGVTLPPAGFRARLHWRQGLQLASMNDGTYCSVDRKLYPRTTFKKIADYIEAHL